MAVWYWFAVLLGLPALVLLFIVVASVIEAVE